jgi:SagB-type dehydrogenase family enzyme
MTYHKLVQLFKMKKFGLFFFILTLTITLKAQDIQLLPPQTTGGMPLMEVLSKRETNRNFSQKEIDNQKLSNLLWAAFGINRSNGKRTAPSARNAQEIDIYVFKSTGVYLYVPAENQLHQVYNQDIRDKLPKQEGFKDAPILILLVANYDKMEKFEDSAKEFYGAIDAGYISQNIYLFCTSENLTTCAIGMIQRDQIIELLKLKGKPIIAHSIGVKEE